METMDLKTILALSLQYRGIKLSEVVNILSSIDFNGVNSIDDLVNLGKSILSVEYGFLDYALGLNEKNRIHGVESISFFSDGYPEYLRMIANAPLILHVKGNKEIFRNINGVAVVGSRKTSKAGEVIAHRIAAQAVQKGWVVVSGLALGVDAAAHRGALSVGSIGSTIAVLAHGLEKAKPASNKALGNEIIENGGAWVSEHAIGVPAMPAQFVQRNRIQLGLSVGSIIVEAEEKSGSITQAKFCVQEKRPLFAVVPESTENPLGLVSSGTQMLVEKMGAIPLKSKLDYPDMFDRFLMQREKMMS